MRTIPDSSGSEGSGYESREDRDIKSPAETKQFFKDLIAKANTVPLKTVFALYKIKISEGNKNIICPFPNHAHGRERSGSFYFYPETSSFYCFGCKTGGKDIGKSVMFVAHMENISQAKAAYKILQGFAGHVKLEDGENDLADDYSEKLEIIMELSEFVRDFIQLHVNDPKCIAYIERVMSGFDIVNSKHDLDNQALKSLISKVKDKVNLHQCP